MALENKKWIIKHQRAGAFQKEDVQIETESIDPSSLKDGEVLLKALYITVDPYLFHVLRNPENLNKVVPAGAVSEVLASKDPNYKEKDIVVGITGWQTIAKTNTTTLRKVDPSLAPISTALGTLGMPGASAYFALLNHGQPKSGETVLISGAAGAVGLLAGQIAKIKGLHVIGIAGSDEKVKLLKELGFDAAINYKTETDIGAAYKRLAPKGIDIYFDNVGGKISDAVLPVLNKHARWIICGQISQYNNEKPELIPRFLSELIYREITIKGFLVSNHFGQLGEFLKETSGWIKEGKVQYKETVVEGFDKLPEAFIGLFKGENTGKQLVKIE